MRVIMYIYIYIYIYLFIHSTRRRPVPLYIDRGKHIHTDYKTCAES